MGMIGSAVDLFNSSLITIPFMQLFLLIVISTLLLLFGKVKFALLINYLFTFYWGFNVNFGESDLASIQNLPLFSLLYLGFGSMIVMLVIVSFGHKTQE